MFGQALYVMGCFYQTDGRISGHIRFAHEVVFDEVVMIRTRLAVPSHTMGSVVRARLLEHVDQLRQRTVTLVQAPAGFGKTTLMAQWKSALDGEAEQTSWLSVDPLDASSEAFTEYMAAMAASPDATFASICNCLAESPAARFLFVDDADLLPHSAIMVLFDLIERMPQHVHFILSSRSQLDAPLGRLRSHKRLFELDARSIAFDRREAAELLRSLDKREQAQVIWHMGGWATGLDLAARRSATSSQRVMGKSPQLAEFLAEEVLDRQPSDIRNFLFETSLLSSMSAPLCDEMCGIGGSAAILPQLRRSGIFVMPLDEDHTEWRYTPFFREYLRVAGDLSQERQTILRKRAATWYVERGDISEALEHLYQAGATDDFAATLEAHCETLTYQGKIFAVERFADRLTRDKLARSPKVMLALAWLRIRQFRHDAARRLLDATTAYVDTLSEDEGADAKVLRSMIAHRETTLATVRDELGDVDEASSRLIEVFADDRPSLTCSLYSQMIYSRCDHFRFAEFHQIEPKARIALEASGTQFASIGLLASIGVGLFAAGRTHDASLALQQSRDVAAPFLGIGNMEGMLALATLPLAELAYELDDRDRAADLIRQYLPAARSFCYLDQMIAGYVTSSRLAQSDGDEDLALRVLDEGTRLASECGLDRLRLSMASEKVRILIGIGRPSEALAVARAEGVTLDRDASVPKPGSSARDEIRATIWVRLAQSGHRVNDAITVAKKWRNFCLSRGATRSLIRWSLALARLYCVSGNPTAAQRALHEAVMAAAPGRFIRSFVDEGAMIEQLLLNSYGSSAPLTQTMKPSEDEFVEALLKAFGSNKSAVCDENTEMLGEGLYGRINAKELEILDLVGRGLRNREIGARLGLTEGTVKWYMQQIYDKLGVRRRPQAVERARQFGMLN